MPRIFPLPIDGAPQAARPAFERFLQERGNVPNMFRTLARRPEMMETLSQHLHAVTYTGTVPVRIKESLAVYVSLRNSCRY
ncbi:MAG: hypothetical protein M0Z66_10020 [Thermaerobacter sp.]|nr:hypothetical protein [Thermaerobacter sp.]